MRVAERNKYLRLVDRLKSNQSRLQETVENISSGKAITRVSDDPVASALIDRIRQAHSRQEAYLEVNHRLREEFEAADAALGNAGNILLRVKELSIQMASGPKSDAVLQGGADEISELRDAFLQTGNAQHRGRFIFGGVADGQPPFDSSGTYVGSTQLREVEVSPHTRIQQISGAKAFTSTPGGVDVADVLAQLQTALENGNQSAASALVDDVDEAISQVNASRQSAGGRLEALEHAAAFSESIILQSETSKTDLEATDIAEASTRLESLTAVLQASAEAASRLKSTDLFMKL